MKKILSFIFIFAVLSSLSVSYAASPKDIFEGNQEYLILGTVKDIDGDSALVTVDNIIAQGSPAIKGTDITIENFDYSYCEEHTPSEFNKPKIGDNVFASLNSGKTSYTVAGGAYKVDSSEAKNCSTIVYYDMKREDCLYDAVKISYFIRTNGKITSFESDDKGNIYAISNDDKILIYPLPGNDCIKFVDDEGKIMSDELEEDVMPIVPNTSPEKKADDNRYLIAAGIIVIGAVLGFAVSYYIRNYGSR